MLVGSSKSVFVSALMISWVHNAPLYLLAGRNRRQYAMTLRNLAYDETLSKIPRQSYFVIKHVFLFNSGISQIRMISLGHLSSFPTNHKKPV